MPLPSSPSATGSASSPLGAGLSRGALLECGLLDDAVRVVDGLALSGGEALECMALAVPRARAHRPGRPRARHRRPAIGRSAARLARHPQPEHHPLALDARRASVPVRRGRRSSSELARAREIDCPRASASHCARGAQAGRRTIATLREAPTYCADPRPARVRPHARRAGRRSAPRRPARRGSRPATRALALADRLRADAVVRQAQAELASAGGRPRPGSSRAPTRSRRPDVGSPSWQQQAVPTARSLRRCS